MARLHIRMIGDEILRRTCRPVERITPRILTLLDDMRETMRAANGCGLAAPQVGRLYRLAVIEVEEGVVHELINPLIVESSGEQEGEEGCLSVPNRWGIVVRPQSVTVRATDRRGEPLLLSGTGLLARAICHELDHLDGRLFVDIASRMTRSE